MKILTLNTHSLRENQYEQKLSWFVEGVLREKPDIIALQEVNQTCDAPVLEPEQVILEVKFDDFLPEHLTACLADIPKIPMAISKFALCMNLML